MIRITEALLSAPEWVRRDMAARDLNVRARAEDTLAAIIAGALVNGE